MKKFRLLLLFAVTLVIVSAFVLPVENPIPDNLKIVFKNSCMTCHSDNGGGMAKANLNFSKWDTYTPEKQVKKAVEICKVVSKGSMPPKSFIKSHPEAVLSDEQKALICKWGESLKK